MNATIILHRGSTSPLLNAIEEAGKTYPFLFTAIEPETRRWAYRLIPSPNPEHLTETQLIELFRRRDVLRADWEEQDGHPLGLITIYQPPEDGVSGGREARFDLGPELSLELKPMRKLREPDVAPKPPAPKIEPSTQDFGMSF
jgi:hypothetical protein